MYEKDQIPYVLVRSTLDQTFAEPKFNPTYLQPLVAALVAMILILAFDSTNLHPR